MEAKGGYPPPLLCPDEATSGILNPILADSELLERAQQRDR